MQAVAPGVFEKLLKSTEPGENELILVKNHDDGQILGSLTVSVTQTNRQFWRVRYVEKTKELTCKPDELVEFSYRPRDDAVLREDVQVRSVNLAGSFNDWSATATPMADLGDGTYVADLKLDEGLHHYKFVVNGNTWMQDPNSDPALRADDGHGSFNSGLFIGERGQDFGAARSNNVNLAAVRHHPEQMSYFNMVSSDTAEVKLRTLQDDVQKVAVHWRDGRERDVWMHRSDTAFGFDYWVAPRSPPKPRTRRQPTTSRSSMAR